jgi:general secretion pathway protein K
MTARRSAGSFSMEQAVELAKGAEALAAYALGQDKNPQDSMLDSWAQYVPPVEVAPEVSLEAQVNDEQGKFNVNTLLYQDGSVNKEAQAVFNRLLELLQIDPHFTSLLIDWMDRDTNVLADGGEDSLYASRTPPHRTANLLVTSISELQQMPEFNRELYLRLAPFITALPPDASTINVCTADREVLDALYAASDNPQLKGYLEYTRMRPEDLATSRKQACFPTRDAHSQNDAKVKLMTAEKSSYFRLHTWVRIGTTQFALYSLMYRDSQNLARPIIRTFGTE